MIIGDSRVLRPVGPQGFAQCNSALTEPRPLVGFWTRVWPHCFDIAACDSSSSSKGPDFTRSQHALMVGAIAYSTLNNEGMAPWQRTAMAP